MSNLCQILRKAFNHNRVLKVYGNINFNIFNPLRFIVLSYNSWIISKWTSFFKTTMPYSVFILRIPCILICFTSFHFSRHKTKIVFKLFRNQDERICENFMTMMSKYENEWRQEKKFFSILSTPTGLSIKRDQDLYRLVVVYIDQFKTYTL